MYIWSEVGVAKQSTSLSLSLSPHPSPSPVHSAGSFNEEISRGKYHSSSDLHFGTTARAGRRVSYQVPADVSRGRQRGRSWREEEDCQNRWSGGGGGKGRRKKRFRFQVSSLSLMNHHQTELHNNPPSAVRFGSPEFVTLRRVITTPLF